VLGAVLAVLCVVYVARPFLREPEPLDDRLDALDEGERRRLALEEERDRALAALKELEFDHRTGAVSDEDYRALVGPLRRQAAEALRALDAASPRAPAPRPHGRVYGRARTATASVRAGRQGLASERTEDEATMAALPDGAGDGLSRARVEPISAGAVEPPGEPSAPQPPTIPEPMPVPHEPPEPPTIPEPTPVPHEPPEPPRIPEPTPVPHEPPEQPNIPEPAPAPAPQPPPGGSTQQN
jgi:hypothetical protein